MKRAAAPAELSAELLLEAYSLGIFPMVSEGGTIEWHKPEPRAIFELDRIPAPDRATRRLLEKAEVTMDTAFEEVMRRCADREESWIDERMVAAYTQLRHQGHAHSVEVRLNEELIGGIYGVTIGAVFFGESMFGRSNAGKAAFHALAARLRDGGYKLFDTQYINPFTERLGAIEIASGEFRSRMDRALREQAELA